MRRGQRERRKGRRKVWWIALAAGVVAVLVGAVVVGVTMVSLRDETEATPVAVTIPVALSGLDVPDDAMIGIVLTRGTGSEEGAEWSAAAQGAVVARERLALGGSDVRLVVVDDGGTERGARDAVRQLEDQGVSGIVYASSGDHVAVGVAAAQDARVPIILPYAPVSNGGSGAWSFAPDETSIGAALARFLAEYDRPLHVNGGLVLPPGVGVADAVRFDVEGDVDATAAHIAARTGGGPVAGDADASGEQADPETPEAVADIVVVTGRPAVQATIVQALQERLIDVPILLAPEALSPSFAMELTERGGTISPTLHTVGPAWGDADALGTSSRSRAGSAYLAALRQFAGDDSILGLDRDAPFAEFAGSADVRSHDAVLLLAHAISTAGDLDPARVLESVDDVGTEPSVGFAGPEIDPAQSHALVGELAELSATAQRLGLRPLSDEGTGLVWIRVPKAL